MKTVMDGGGPSLGSELRRGLNPYSLGVAALAAGGLWLLADWRGSPVPGASSTFVAGALFIAIAGVHAGLHAYFGWRLGRGLRALAEGDAARAERLLRILDRRGLAHYDPQGQAARALATLRESARSY